MIKFGIVIPTYNRAHLLTRAIDSVLNQSYQNFIICVIEDCSSDNTKEIMELNYKNNKKIHYIRLEKNGGVNKARNAGLDYLLSKEISCDYITFLDDDDYFSLNVFSEAKKQIELIGIHWLVFNRVYQDGKKITNTKTYNKFYDYLYDYYLGFNFKGDTCMFISNKAVANHRFYNSVRAREYLFFALISKDYQMYVVDFDAIICEYLEHGLTMSHHIETTDEKIAILNIEKEVQVYLNLKENGFKCIHVCNTIKQSFQKMKLDRLIKYLIRYLKHKCFNFKID